MRNPSLGPTPVPPVGINGLSHEAERENCYWDPLDAEVTCRMLARNKPAWLDLRKNETSRLLVGFHPWLSQSDWMLTGTDSHDEYARGSVTVVFSGKLATVVPVALVEKTK